MSAHVFQAAEEGNLRIDVVYQSTSEGECDSQENDHSTAEDSDEDSSKLDSKDEAEEGGCHCQICVRDGAYSIVTGEPLDRDLRHQNIRSGSKVLMGVILIYALIDFCVGIFVWISYHKLKEVLLAFGKFRIASHIVVQTATFISMAFCVQRPRLVIYFPTIIVWTLYTVIFWLFLPLQLINDTGGWHRKDGRLESFLNFYNPNAAGSIALHGLMWLIFLMPLLVPERRLMPLVSRLWIGLFFGIMSLCIGVWPEPKPNEKVEGVTVTQSLERYRYNFDLTVSVLFLGAGFLIVYTRKQAIEEDQLTISRLDQQKQGVSEHMFSILGCMVPAFLLEPMLKDPDRTKPIAEKMDKASILFIMFVGFDQMVRATMSPHQLLIFLNRYFTQIDEICADCGVMKIETVGHEYVCAVGVSPNDRVQDRHQGHQSSLGQLVRVAFKVLALQNGSNASDEPVAFQMGIHTGSVVAGVVGQRLPRFRLFGDTINTAARMMQKGLPGEVQFGEATHRELPSWVGWEERGKVEMKGKGLVTTYLLRPGTRGTSPSGVHPGSSSMTLRSQQGGRGGTPANFRMGSGSFSLQSGASPLQGGCSYNSADYSGGRAMQPPFRMPPTTLGPAIQTGSPELRRGVTQLLFDVSESREFADKVLRQRVRAETNFDKIMQVLTVNSVSKSSKRVQRFTSATQLVWSRISRSTDEDVFRAWFHETCFCKDLVRRTRRFTKIFASVSIMETLYLVCNHRGMEAKFGAPLTQLDTFLACRLGGLAILITWLSIVGCYKWVHREAKITQRCMLASWCVLLALTYTSYNSMPFVFDALPTTKCSFEKLGICDFPLVGVSRNIIFLNCFPLCMVVMLVHPFTFVQSWAFPVLMLGLIFFVEILPDTQIANVLSNPLVKIIFFISSMVRSHFAYVQEANLRDRHQKQYTLNQMMRNVEGILGTLMPPQVLESLREDPAEAKPQHHYSHATVVQSDLVGFTQLASMRDPADVVQIIGDIFRLYDKLADKRGVYKVETVGDAYIAAQAELPLSATNSPLDVVLFGIEMVEATNSWAEANSETVSCRVGVHTGECVGGIVGNDMQRYHLFGHLMTVLEVLESTAPKGRVQVSLACKRAVEREVSSQQISALPWERVHFQARGEEALQTSKGETHALSEVGGPTFLASRLLARISSGDT